jgi:outer membrane autotransporter protein
MAANPAARRARLLGGSAIALVAALAGARAAWSANECGVAAPGGTVTCTPAGNSFPDGISYKVNDLTIVVQDGVVIDTTGAAERGISTGGNAGNYGDLTVQTGTAGGITITTTGANSDAVFAYTKDGGITITGMGDLTTTGALSSGIDANSGGGDIVIDWQGDIATAAAQSVGISAVNTSANSAIQISSTGDISTDGTDSRGIYAKANAGVRTVSTGDLSTKGEDSTAIDAYSKAGATLIYSTGDITTTGKYARGISAISNTLNTGVFSAGNISTSGDKSAGIYVIAADGAAVVQSSGIITTSGKFSNGIYAIGTGDAEVYVRAIGGGAITTTGYGSVAIQARADSGTVHVTSSARLTTSGTYADGIHGYSKTGGVTITQTGDIATKGNAADGISAIGKNEVNITSVANITIAGSAEGISAYSSADDVTITSTGDISTAGKDANAILAMTKDGGILITSTGDISTQGKVSTAIYAIANDGGAKVISSGNISTVEEYSAGIAVKSNNDAAYIISSGNVSTQGVSSIGLFAQGSYAQIDHTGSVMTSANGTEAIIAVAKYDSVAIDLSGAAITKGDNADAITGYAVDGEVRISASGVVRSFGQESDGIVAIGKSAVRVTAENVIATGKNAYGIVVDSDTGDVVVTTNGAVLGGWDNAAGIWMKQSKESRLIVDTGSSVGALSDFAIYQDDDKLTLSNNGVITGSFFFESGDDSFFNSSAGMLDLRLYGDSDGDLVRDTEEVAIGNFEGDKDSFNNEGVLRLGNATGATKWDTTGQILHPGGGNSDITQEGIEQGFLLGLETFRHAGLITLSDGVAGDLLVITDQADGKTKGANVFTSDGGSLALDVVLDDGSSKQSDVLILDKADTGTGATRVLIANAGGIGGQTSGDGIMVINVRDTSDADAFALGNRPVAGAYEYRLVYQNAAKTDQNWYLQSDFFEGSLEYPAIVSGVLETWQSGLGSLHDQMRSRRTQVEMQDVALAELPNTATDIADGTSVRMHEAAQAGWFRVSGSDMEYEQAGTADFDLNATRAEGGFDVGFGDLLASEDWLVAGAFAGYGWSRLDFASGSDAKFDIATIGAYATYFRGPYYLDAVVKLDWLDGSFNSENVGTDGDLSLPVFGVSLESGYRFDLPTPQNWGGLYLQPQAQLSFAHSGADSFTDNSGSRIALEDADSLRGRLGARLGQELKTTAGAGAEPVTGNFYLEASVNQEFLGEVKAKVTGLTLNQELPETTFALGGGFDIALPKEGVSFTVDADYILGDEAEGFTATGGFRIHW